jgi:hypothetical protein
MKIEECRLFYAEEIRYAANVQTPGLVEAYARCPARGFSAQGRGSLAPPRREQCQQPGPSRCSTSR